MKNILLISITLLFVWLPFANATIIYVSGNVSGTWSADTVMVTGEITVPVGQTLVIQPGVKVLFQVYCKLIVEQNATLSAVGTASERILFDELTFGTHWWGIRFMSASNASRLEYCLLRNGYAQETPNFYDGDGGGVLCHTSSPTIAHCRFEYCSADYDGGGIYCFNSQADIYNNLFYHNSAFYNGGAIMLAGSNPLIVGNIFYGNVASWQYGGGISVWGTSDPMIEDNLFYDNNTIAAGGGGSGGAIACIGGFINPTIQHNVFTYNHACFLGGAIFCQSIGSTIKENVIFENYAGDGGGIGGDELDSLTIIDNLIVHNHATDDYGAGGGIYCGDCLEIAVSGNTVVENFASIFGGGGGMYGANISILDNNIFWGNTPTQIYSSPTHQVHATYCDVQNGWAGLGNINQYPTFVNTAYYDYRLLWGSPCIDTGDPNPIYNDPDSTRADMGAFYYDQSTPVRILLSPHAIPYFIPASGGSMDYTIHCANRDSLAHSVIVWCDVTLPDSSMYGPVFGPIQTTISAGATLSRNRTQNVPSIAPMGVYHYNIYAIVGTDTSRDSFLWGKMGMGNWENKAENWSNAGESLGQITSKRPNEFSPVSAILYPAIPNPFNSSTTLTFDLLSAGEVSLIIYDIQGREVAKLETRNLKLGTNQIVWNAEGLPSGVYFVRLSVVGSRSSVQKIVLLK